MVEQINQGFEIMMFQTSGGFFYFLLIEPMVNISLG